MLEGFFSSRAFHSRVARLLVPETDNGRVRQTGVQEDTTTFKKFCPAVCWATASACVMVSLATPSVAYRVLSTSSLVASSTSTFKIKST